MAGRASSPITIDSSQSPPSRHLTPDWICPLQRPQYRRAKPIPYDLRLHCIIYLEEGLYSDTLTVLTNLLFSGNSSSITRPPVEEECSAYIPSPNLLALLTTFVVHPSTTTRCTSVEKEEAANQSLRFLSDINAIVGPTNARFRSAFQHIEKGRNSFYRRSGHATKNRTGFLQARRRSRGRQEDSIRPSSSEADDDQGEDENDQDDFIQMGLASDKSLWACATDFWHIMGWAFNCAARWRQRWARWKLLLQLMLDILEDDWAERSTRSQNNRHASANFEESLDRNLGKSLIVQFLDECERPYGGGPNRRVLHAIFANGSEADVAEFKEIFPRETVAARRRSADAIFNFTKQHDMEDPRDFADYEEVDDEDSDGVHLSQSHEADAPDAEAITSYGGHEAMQLRRRIIALLAKVADSQAAKFVDLSSFVDVLEEHIRPLPLPVYLCLISPSDHAQDKCSFFPAFHMDLLQELARTLLTAEAPRSRHYYLTQNVLQRNFLPFPASTSSIVDNTKLSLVLEGMIRLMLAGDVELSGRRGKLREIVENGIRARKLKIQSSRGRSESGTEALAWQRSSVVRLRLLVDEIESSERKL